MWYSYYYSCGSQHYYVKLSLTNFQTTTIDIRNNIVVDVNALMHG